MSLRDPDEREALVGPAGRGRFLQGRIWRVALLVAASVCWEGGESPRAEYAGAPGARPGVDAQLPLYTPVAAVSGRLTIAGSDSMQPILVALVRQFRLWHPQVKIAVQGARGQAAAATPGLLETFLNQSANWRRGDGNTSGHEASGDVRILALSRDMTKDEIKEFVERFGYKPTAIPIAQDAVAVYVHRDNPVPRLTLDQLDAIFSKTRYRGLETDLTTWGQVGLPQAWEGSPIHLYGRNKRSAGTRPFFMEHVLLNGQFRDSLQEEPGSASVVLAVSRDPAGIGYSGIGFQSGVVRVVPLGEKPEGRFVEPTRETVMNGSYPLSRRLHLYVNMAPGETLPPAVLEFLTFANSRQGQALVAASGVYPVAPAQVARNLQVLLGPAGAPPVAAAR